MGSFSGRSYGLADNECRVVTRRLGVTMFCTSCGAAVPADGKFCGACGRAVSEVNVSPSQEAWPEAAIPPPIATDSPWVSPRGHHKESNSTPPRPWLRFGAKMVDVWVWVIVLGSLAGILFPRWSAEANETLFGLILFACAVPIHAALLSWFGTTIGKALFNIKVTKNGQRLNFGQAFGREVRCYVRGLGLGLPIIYLITMFVSYQDLKKAGSSSWDRDYGNVVTHKDPHVAGIIGAIVILGLAFALTVWGTIVSQAY